MSNSVIRQLKDKLTKKDNGSILYDLNGNEIGRIEDGKMILEGTNVSNTIIFDEDKDGDD